MMFVLRPKEQAGVSEGRGEGKAAQVWARWWERTWAMGQHTQSSETSPDLAAYAFLFKSV